MTIKLIGPRAGVIVKKSDGRVRLVTGQAAVNKVSASVEAMAAATLAARDETEGYRDEAEAFVAMATDARDIYPDTASGLAAVADGKYFWVASAVSGEIAALFRDVAGVATDTGKRATDAAALARHSAYVSGRATPAAGTAWTANLTVIPDEFVAPASARRVRSFRCYGQSAGVLEVAVFDHWVDGGQQKFRKRASITKIVAAGLVDVVCNLAILPGQKVGYRHSGQAHYGGGATSPDPGVYYTSGSVTTDAAGTVIATVNAGLVMQAAVTFEGEVSGAALTAGDMADAYGGDIVKLSPWITKGMTASVVHEEAGPGGAVEVRLYRNIAAGAVGDTYEFGVEMKAIGRSRVALYSNAGPTFSALFDLSSGGASGTGSPKNRAMGDGWREVVVSGTDASVYAASLQIRLYPASGGPTYDPENIDAIALGRAWFKRNGMLVFEQTYFEGAEWTKNNVTIVSNAAEYGGWLEAMRNTAYAQGDMAALDITFVGTSLVAQGMMTGAFASISGATVQALGSGGGALGLDARASPHYGSGAVTALLPSINANADIIVLDMPVNDVAASDVPLGAITDTTTATYYGALANFFAWCEANRPAAKVAVVAPVAASATFAPSDYRQGVANANGDTLEDFQIATRRACDWHGRPCIDPGRFGVSYLDAGDNTSDGLHWDADGGARVAKIYAAEIRRLIAGGWLE